MNYLFFADFRTRKQRVSRMRNIGSNDFLAFQQFDYPAAQKVEIPFFEKG